MSDHFAKVYGTILDSSIWAENDPTRILWITMLAMADSTGYIEAAVPGLQGRARITMEETEAALEIFQAPDPHSKDPNNDGRRVEKAEGGWQLLNYQKYRDRRTESQVKRAKRQARYREKKREREGFVHSGMPASDEVLWKEVVQFYGGRCAYCEKNPWTEFDHVIPTVKGGGNGIDNRVPACRSCNAAKKDKLWKPERSHPYYIASTVDGVDGAERHKAAQKGEGRGERGEGKRVVPSQEGNNTERLLPARMDLVPTRDQSIVANAVLESLKLIGQTEIVAKELLGWQIKAGFAYWVTKMGKNNNRVKLSLGRWARLEKYIKMYDLETCLYAIDGALIHPDMNQDGRTFHEFEEIFMNKPEGPGRVEKLSEHARKKDRRPKHRLLKAHPQLEGHVK